MTAGAAIEMRARLSPDEVRDVIRLVDEVTDSDAVRPLSEHVMLHLRYGGDDRARNFVLRVGGEVVGYAHLDTTDAVQGASAELAVSPRHRGMGYGRQLVEALVGETTDRTRLRLWAHGTGSGATDLARSMGFKRERVLWQMRRSLFAPVPEPQWPAGVTVRTFVVGADEHAWLEVNNHAFAEHPDQGIWTLDDLRMREQEPWFDAAGFFLAEDDGRLVGFHWTKVHGAQGTTVHGAQSTTVHGAQGTTVHGAQGTTVHGAQSDHSHDGEHAHDPIGEVYVVGVDPSMQGKGLGPALTLRGLQHLRARGLSQCMLYVDESNTNAIRTYERLGFSKWDVDVCFLQQ